ncbi:MAG TPA: tricarballylate utilization 4Fe-4S protein TcuB [Pseudolabrys sp.]|jgi:citrate/tricarballylate utilization protein|nr:tricarballylate utilization 4Fe-4S protein TcuB [Pseudolabrys sp.]
MNRTHSEALHEADRLMTICNACRYCEGLCAVFPAMEMRRTFTAGDLHYLANLCHQCGACYPDCQYAPPHQFDVDVPAALARLRNASYAAYAWPRAFANAFVRNGLVVTLLAAASVAIFVITFVAVQDPAVLFERHGGDFYRLMPHSAMVGIFGAVALYDILVFALGLRAFWRDIGGSAAGPVAWGRAIRDAGELRYLGGGGGGCMSENEKPSRARRLFHHFTFYGFLLCFAATCVGTIYHYGFAWYAPYPFFSLPVILGTLGGIGLLVGPVGLYVLARLRAPHLTDRPRLGMDEAFTVMLFLTSLTGLLLLGLRGTASMGMLLAVHLGFVLGLFLSLPYGKFVHALYRLLALVKYAAERHRAKLVE